MCASAPTKRVVGADDPVRPMRRKEESPSHGFAVPAPFRQGGRGDGGTDCHSQCTHWLRNDIVFAKSTIQSRAGRPGGRPLRMHNKGCGKTGRCGERTKRCRWQRKRGERVAAVKISSVRRKAAQKFWAPQQDPRPLRKRNKRCNGRVTARVAPTKALQGVRGKNPPVTASPCQPPLGKGAEGTEVADCHSQCAHWLRNDRVSMECGA